MHSTLLRIPIAQIRPNPKHQERGITRAAVESTAASMMAFGQEEPIQVRKISSALAPVRRPKEKNPKPGEYEIIGGLIRLEAAKKLGWQALVAQVLELNPDRAEI